MTSGTSIPRYPQFRDLSPFGQAATVWFRALGRALKSCKLYKPDNPIVQQIRDQIYTQLAQLLLTHRGMHMRMTPIEIYVGDEAVVHPSGKTDDLDHVPGKEEQLPFVFYRDGIRAMTLQPELPRVDFDALFDALLAASGTPLTHDDLVTLMWQANATHIQIEALPVTQTIYLSSRRPSGGAKGGGQAGQAYHWTPGGDEIHADIGQIAGMAQGLHKDTFDDWPLPETAVEVPAAYAALTRGMEFTRTRFIMEWTNETVEPWTELVPKLARRTLQADASPEMRDALAHAVVTWLAATVQRSAWTEGRAALELLRELDPDGSITNEPLAALLAGVDTDEISERLDESQTDDQSLFFALAVAMGLPVLDLACAVMAKAQKSRTRAAACTMLCYLCGDRPERLAKYLNDSRWYVVRNTVFVLGQIGGPDVVELLSRAAFHSEPRVRRQVVQSLGGVPRAASLPVLLGQLDTRDPQLLAATLNMLTRQRDPAVATAILKQIEAPDFETRSDDNQRSLFGALAEIADDDAVPALEALLQRGGWFARRTLQRSAAARTLARLASPKAAAVLDAGLRSRSEAVRHACLEAMSVRQAA